jgi:pimeloyl-ACP methyl ester carboxylesterase
LVSYRSDGSGTPLVLITGFGGSQDTWPPSLVNALAADHRVIIFDNAGIGQTTLPPGHLTISAMAAQTNALIQALGLGKPAVLGWSMGGMIAQALAVLYPNDVSRLVLCATLPGNGTAVGPSTSLLSGLLHAVSTDDVSELMPLLFPPDQVSSQGPQYVAALLTYPGFYNSSTPVDDAQFSAVESWLAGTDSGGHGKITAPTLIGDGASDVLVASVNDKAFHKSIAGSKLSLYRDAGHGFVFQDAAKWAKRVNKFLG